MCTDPNELFLKGQWLINDVNRIVEESLLGLVRCNPSLAILDTGGVVIRKEHLISENVKILSGGASGHEPCYAGFVGHGMLTASVQGSIFSAPTSELVLRTIKELARRTDMGILIIIGNNMGDRLNFGLAMERAKIIKDVKIKMLIASDSVYEKRCIMGTIILQKLAGAMAEQNIPLLEIYMFCKEIKNNISTALVSLRSAVSPYFEVLTCSKFLYDKEMEYGTGLHNEPGSARVPLKSTFETVQNLLGQLSANISEQMPIALFINNLGSSSKLEEMIFVNEVIQQLHSNQIKVEKIYAGSFVTALEMAGFSITILKITDAKIVDLLNAPCEAPFWKFFSEQVIEPYTSPYIKSLVPFEEKRLKENRGPYVSDIVATMIKNAISFGGGALISCEKQLNIIDSESGDADTGTNLKRGCVNIKEHMTRGKLKINWPFMLFEELSEIIDKNYGSFSCSMYAIMFACAAQPFAELSRDTELTASIWCEVFDAALTGCIRYGRTSLGKRTMYDALHSGYNAFKCGISNDMPPLDAFGLATGAAEDTAHRTRASNQIHPDPGAHAVGIWMRAVYESLKLDWNSVRIPETHQEF